MIRGVLTIVGIYVIAWMIHPGIILSVAIGYLILELNSFVRPRLERWRTVRAFNRKHKIVNCRRWRWLRNRLS